MSNWSGCEEVMIGRLNHVAIVVPDLRAAMALYRDTLGATVLPPHALPEHGVTAAFVELGNTRIELLEPLGENSPVGGFLARNRDGAMHHVCYEAARDRGAGARRRRAEDRRARQARAVSPPEGFLRHVDRAGRGLMAPKASLREARRRGNLRHSTRNGG
jgi:methylmalonyl-CoA/ethylmalonyl-CoA epimerase